MSRWVHFPRRNLEDNRRTKEIIIVIRSYYCLWGKYLWKSCVMRAMLNKKLNGITLIFWKWSTSFWFCGGCKLMHSDYSQNQCPSGSTIVSLFLKFSFWCHKARNIPHMFLKQLLMKLLVTGEDRCSSSVFSRPQLTVNVSDCQSFMMFDRCSRLVHFFIIALKTSLVFWWVTSEGT